MRGACDPVRARFVSWVFILLTVCGARAASAQSISGKVTDAATGLPIAGVGVQILTTAGINVTQPGTDVNGDYSASGFPFGDYYVLTNALSKNYLAALYGLNGAVQCPPFQQCPLAQATLLSLQPGSASRSNINIALTRGATIFGTVRNATTLAPINALHAVDVFNAAGTKLGFSNVNFGTYVTPVLPPGTYFLKTTGFSISGYVDERYDGAVCDFSCNPVGGPGVTVAPPTNVTLDFALAPGARVSGSVIEQFSGLNSFVNITAFDQAGNAVAQTQSFTTYTLGPLPLGTYRVTTSNAVPGQTFVHEVFDNIPCTPACNVAAGTDVVLQTLNETKTANFELIQERFITGRITNALTGAGVNGVQVSVFNAAGNFVTGATTETARGVTGRYRTALQLSAGGPYYVRTTGGASMGFNDQVYGGPTCSPTCNVTSGTPITVVAFQQVENVNIALSQGSARFSGTVTSGGTGLGGVTVKVLNTSGGVVTSTVTSSAAGSLGTYSTSVLPTPGPYYIGTFDASAQGFQDQLHNGVVCTPNCQLTAGTLVSLTSAGATINFSLLQPNKVTGTVTGESGPLAGVTVQITNATTLANVTSAVTAANGTYTVNNVPAGSYFVRTVNTLGYFDEIHNDVQCFGCNLGTAGGTPIAFAGSAGGAATIDFALTRGGQITGRITDAATGAALGGAQVQVLDASARILSTTTTSNVAATLGNYGTSGLPAGTYFLRAAPGVTFHISEVYDDLACVPCRVSDGTPIQVTVGGTVTGIDFALTSGGRISGVVRDAATNAPIQGLFVDIVNSAGATAGFAPTQANGSYTSIGLPPGTYFTRVRANANSPAASHGYVSEVYDDRICSGCNPLSGTPINVQPNVITSNVDFLLNKGARVAGQVEDSQNSQPLAGVSVAVFNAAGLQATSAVTNAAGEYLTPDGLAAGTYHARANGIGYLNQLFANLPCVGNCVPTSGTGINVPASGTLSGIDFSLQAGGRIAGTVTAAGGAPVAGLAVAAFNSSGALVGFGTTNVAGAYITGGLPSGTYYVRFNNSLGYVNEVYPDLPCIGCDPQNIGTPITVTAGSTVSGIDFVLEPGGRVAGTVTDTFGVALSGVNVEVYADPTAKAAATAVTNSLGVYVTPNGLPPGNYTARTTNGLGFINERFDDVACTADCSPAAGTPIPVTPPATTGGIDFVLDADADLDGDGMLSSIDTNKAAFSDGFSDVSQGGATAGTIVARGGWVVNVADASPAGVTASLSGAGATPAILHACSPGGTEELRLDAAGESVSITCDADSGSITVKALAAFPKIELQKTVGGITTLIELVSGQTVTFGSPVVADPANVDPLQITLLDGNAVLGNFALDPGESAEAVRAPSGAITVTVFEGTVPVTIGDEEKTLGPGQVAVADAGGFVLCTPLLFSALAASPTELKTPNHKMAPISLSPTLGGVCGTATCRVVAVTSNEPANGTGDGDTSPDWSFGSGLSMSVRSERDGTGSGRVYTITVECTDDGGGVQRRTVTVSVPH